MESVSTANVVVGTIKRGMTVALIHESELTRTPAPPAYVEPPPPRQVYDPLLSTIGYCRAATNFLRQGGTVSLLEVNNDAKENPCGPDGISCVVGRFSRAGLRTAPRPTGPITRGGWAETGPSSLHLVSSAKPDR